MRRLGWLGLGWFLRGIATTHLAGALVLVLVLTVESRDPGGVATSLTHELPPLWAGSAAVLTLLGAALAAGRATARREVRALACLGVRPELLVGLAFAVGAVVGVAVGATPRIWLEPAYGDWVRGVGGWFRAGVAVPDLPGGVVTALAEPGRLFRGAEVFSGGFAGALGAAVGLRARAGTALVLAGIVLVVDFTTFGLVDRGALPASATFAVGGLCAAFTLLLLTAGSRPRAARATFAT